MADPNRARRRLLLPVALVGLALAAGALREHRTGGVALELLAFAALLAAPALRRVLAAFDLVEPAPRFLFAIELASLAALLETPVATFGPALAALAATLGACPAIATAPRRPHGLERAGLVVFALLAALAVAASRHSVERAAPWAALPLAVLLLEALASAPRARAGDPSRQASALALVAASGLTHAHWGIPAFEVECVTLVGSWLASLWALADLGARLAARGDPGCLLATRRRLAFATLAVAAPLAVLGVAGEVAIRRLPPSQAIHGPPIVDDGTGSFHAPGERYVFPGPVLSRPEPRDLVRNEFTWNRDGFHDLDHDLAKPASCVRVAVVGDSFVDAYQLRLADTLARLLEPELQRATPAPLTVETLAFARAGWCQRQELAVLRDRALRYRPDLVLLEFLPSNDVYENDPEDFAAAADESRGTLASFLSGVARRRGLLFAGLVAERAGRAARRLVPARPRDLTEEVWRESLPEDRAAEWERAWARTTALVGEIAGTVSSSGARLAVVVFANENEVEDRAGPAPARSGFDFMRPSRRMAAICERLGVPCLELAPRLGRREPSVREQMFLAGDGHWSSVGHRCAAEETARFLTAETPLWRAVTERAARER